MSVIILKILVVLVCTGSFGIVYRFRAQVVNLPASTINPILAAAFVLFRIVPFIAIYLVAGQETHSDVPVFYEAARQALQGKVVYRDFWSPYSPLFAYLTALPLIFWHSAKAVVLLMILVEGIAWWLTYRFYYSRRGRSVQLSALLYMLLPAPLSFCVLGGQEDVWMWAVGAVSLYQWQAKPNAFRLGLIMALMLLVTKALAILIVIGLLFWVRQPVRYVAGLLTIGLPGLVVLYALTGMGMLTPLMFANLPFAPNLWTVLAPIIGNFMSYASVLSGIGLVVVVTLAAYCGWQLRLRNRPYEDSLPLLWILCFGFLMFVHKSSFGNYAFIYLIPLLFCLIDWRNRADISFLLVLNALVTIQPSYWWRIGAPLMTNITLLSNSANLIEYAMEVGVVVSVGYFVWRAYQQTATINQEVSSSSLLTLK